MLCYLMPEQDELDEQSRIFLHIDYHKAEYPIHDSDRRLECPVCCALPPWEWGKDEYYPESSVYPVMKSDLYGFCGCYATDEEGEFAISYINYGWRTRRVWKAFPCPIHKCRKCGRWRTRYESKPPKDASEFWAWSQNAICEDCMSEETKAFELLPIEDQLEEIEHLCREAKRRRHD